MEHTLKKVANQTVEKFTEELHAISHELWSNPELGYQEHHAHAYLTDFFEKQGFAVTRKYVVDTAFQAEFGTGHPHVAVMCEYDALPGIGHACGHNLIAEVAAAAALAIKAAMQEASEPLGKLTVLGTPAEEGGGGKVRLIKAGALDGVDFALMAHPTRQNIYHGNYLSRDQIHIKYEGKASHASGEPWGGINALDAAFMCYGNISCLRQQMKPTWRVHGVITNGGERPNIIPELTTMHYYSRAPTKEELSLLTDKIRKCAEAAAIASGCSLTFMVGDTPYHDMITSPKLADIYIRNAAALGKPLDMSHEAMSEGRGSTDMGNVTQVVPGMHPLFSLGDSTPENHTREFAAIAGSPEAQPMTLREGKILAYTAIDVFLQPHLVEQMKADLKQELDSRKTATGDMEQKLPRE